MTKPPRSPKATARRNEIESYIEHRRDQLGELGDALGHALLAGAPPDAVETLRAERRRLSEELQDGLDALRILWASEEGGTEAPTWAAALKIFDGAYRGVPDLTDETDRAAFFSLLDGERRQRLVEEFGRRLGSAKRAVPDPDESGE